MTFIENYLCYDRSAHAYEHIPLGVPDITLSAEERSSCSVSAYDGGPPFDKLIKCAKGETLRIQL
jgi:hypothetical protein